MKNFSVKTARAFASVVVFCMIAVVCAVCLLPERTVAIVGGESYAPIYHGSKKNAKIALMFNVYENANVVSGILDTLKEHDVKATFFVGGCWADDNTDLLLRIIDEGHELGNHGYFHKNHKKISEAENTAEIKNNHDVIFGITDYKMSLFAPPSGAYSTQTLKVAEKLGYKTIMWSKDTIDWRDSDEQLIIKRATKVENGDFVLMHPKAHTLNVLPKILEFYKEKGIRPVTVSECIKDDI